MKGLCTTIIKHHVLPEHGVEGYPTYEVIAELSYPIEEGEHQHLELNDVLTLREVQANQLHGDVYSLTFNLEHQDKYREQTAPTQDVLAAMFYAQQGFLKVSQVISAMRERIRAVVPQDIEVLVELEGPILHVKIGVTDYFPSLRAMYLQHLLTGPMIYTWHLDGVNLRMQHNMPDAQLVESWFEAHNKALFNSIKDTPEVAACCLACTNYNRGMLDYHYIVVLMNGTCNMIKMDTGQVLAMVQSGKQPEVKAAFVAGEGLDLAVYNDSLLPLALPFVEELTDEQLALTASL